MQDTITIETSDRGEVLVLRKQGKLVIGELMRLGPVGAAQLSGALVIAALKLAAREHDREAIARVLAAFERTNVGAVLEEASQLSGRHSIGEQLTPKITIIRGEEDSGREPA